MTLIVQNSRALISPENLKLKILLVGVPGSGKTSFVANAPNVGIGVSETGHGKGLLSVAASGVDYVEINSYEDFEAFCGGAVFHDKDTLGMDSLSDIAKTLIKDKALKIPRTKGESQKRLLGVPELDDFGTMAELTRKLTKKFIDQPKHIICTAGLRIDKPDPENLQAETLIGADFPGQLFLGCSAMFDIVLIARSRSVLQDVKDAKSRYQQRYWMTEGSGGYIAKNRLSVDPKIGSFLPPELIYDFEKDSGTFNDIYNRAKDAYVKYLATVKAR
jgi:AAA domain